MKTLTFTRTVEVDVEFEAEIDPAEKGTPRTMGDPGTPDWPASASVIAASVGGVGIPLQAIDRGDLRRMEDEALEQALDIDDAFEAAAEDEADRRREDRLLGI